MTGRRITAGLSVLCALVFCAFSASASAAGTTAFTCIEGGGQLDFSDADCATFVGASNGEYGHVALTPKTSTKVELNNVVGVTSKLMGTFGGITMTFTATGFKSKNTTCENTEQESRMVQKCTGEGEFTGVTLSEGAPGCEVEDSTIKLLSTEFGTKEMEVNFKPTSTSFAEFTFEKCTTPGLNLTYKVIGTFNGIPNGAVLNFTEASTSGLKLFGQSAFLVTTLTEKMKAETPSASQQRRRSRSPYVK
jgi:hypothetical protein